MTSKPAVARPTLLLPFRNRAAYVEHAFDRGPLGGVFVPGEVDVALDDEVDLEVSFAEEQVRFHVRAVVRWKRDASRRSIGAGVGLELLPTESRARDALLAFVGGAAVHHKERAARRYGVRAAVKVKADGRALTAVTDDLSEGGAFLLLDETLPVGAELSVVVKAPGALVGVQVPAVVTWVRGDGDRRGVGVQFALQDAPRTQAKVARVVRTWKERLVRDLQVKAPRLPSSPPAPANPEG